MVQTQIAKFMPCKINHAYSKSRYTENEMKLMYNLDKYRHVPSIMNVWTKYGKPRLYDNGDTDLITKT